jgi:2-oxoacid:acceptor oxidoreductase gamma subunit (pyruvate/2-ketoisovalerate family)
MGAEILAQACVLEGNYASSVPSFGVERRGAPVTAFLRLDHRQIRDTHQIYEPDCVVILDPSFARMAAPLQGLKNDGIVVVNTARDLENHYSSFKQVKSAGLLDATGIALEVLGRPISNTCMLGAISRATGWVGLDAILASLELYFKGEILRRNTLAVRRGHEDLRLVRFDRGPA